MKRYIRQVTRIELDIIAVLNIAETVESSKNVEWRELPASYQLSNAQFEAYQNFIRSAVSIIRKFGFEVVDEYQSNKSYSYYIQFTPEPYAGFEDKMLQLDVKFRLSDHAKISQAVTSEPITTKSSGVIFKSFVVEGVEHSNIAATLLDIKEICLDLKQGDYDRLN